MDVPTGLPTTAAAAPSSAPAAPQGETSPRGNLAKKVGDTGGWGAQNVDISVKFVDKITVDLTCPGRLARKAENGLLVQMDFRVEATPNMTTDSGYFMSAYHVSAVGPDGVTQPSVTSAATFSCLNTTNQLPVRFSPGSEYRGSVVLDVSRTLIFRPSLAAGGWEWEYGAA